MKTNSSIIKLGLENTLKNLTTEELLRYVDRSNYQIKLLAETLEIEIEERMYIEEKYYHLKQKKA